MEGLCKTVAEEADALLASLGSGAVDGSSPAVTAPYAEDLPYAPRAPGLAVSSHGRRRCATRWRSSGASSRPRRGARRRRRAAAGEARLTGARGIGASSILCSRHRRALRSARRRRRSGARHEGRLAGVREAEARVSAEAAAAAGTEEAHRAELAGDAV